MANTINNIGSTPPGAPVDPADLAQTSNSKPLAGTQSEASGPGDAAATAPVENAKLSALGATLTAATRRAVAQTAFRADLVARLKAQVSSNSYQIDMQGLARTIAGVIGRSGR
jgi:anti-sigma28 factor (negative regulator of flagellin synthesis)